MQSEETYQKQFRYPFYLTLVTSLTMSDDPHPHAASKSCFLFQNMLCFFLIFSLVSIQWPKICLKSSWIQILFVETFTGLQDQGRGSGTLWDKTRDFCPRVPLTVTKFFFLCFQDGLNGNVFQIVRKGVLSEIWASTWPFGPIWTKFGPKLISHPWKLNFSK